MAPYSHLDGDRRVPERRIQTQMPNPKGPSMTKNRHSHVLPAVAVGVLLIAALALSACSSQASASSRTGAKAAVATASTAAATPAAKTPIQVAAPVAAAPAAVAPAPAGPDARSVISGKCTRGCHQAAKVLGYRAGSASQAQSIVSSMTKKGGLTQAEAQAIVAYYSN
jgi:hypothetical protein